MTEFAEVFVDQGQDIRKTIEAFVIEKGWKEVIVVNAIGSVKDLILAAPIRNELPLKVGRTPCYGAAEILSFTGEIMVKDRMDPQLRQVYPDTDSPLFIQHPRQLRQSRRTGHGRRTLGRHSLPEPASVPSAVGMKGMAYSPHRYGHRPWKAGIA